MTPRSLLVIGSPREPANSESLGVYFQEELEKCGWETLPPRRVYQCLDDESALARLSSEILSVDLVVFSFPLFDDSVPAAMLELFGGLAKDVSSKSFSKLPRVLVIVNNGCPETSLNQIAVDICRRFCQQVGFPWAGALCMGMGMAINQRPLRKLGREFNKTRNALSLSAKAVSTGEAIPDEAIRDIGAPLFPYAIYRHFSTLVLIWMAFHRRGLFRMFARPFERE